MRRRRLVVAVVLSAGFVAIQLVPVERTNRLGSGDPDAPREVQYILRRACDDGHATETRWPIWAYIAPFSWLVVRDVEQARQTINFSDWQSYDENRRAAYRLMVGPVTATHRMPLWYYLTLHPDAALSDEDLETLDLWARAALSPAVPAAPDSTP